MKHLAFVFLARLGRFCDHILNLVELNLCLPNGDFKLVQVFADFIDRVVKLIIFIFIGLNFLSDYFLLEEKLAMIFFKIINSTVYRVIVLLEKIVLLLNLRDRLSEFSESC